MDESTGRAKLIGDAAWVGPSQLRRLGPPDLGRGQLLRPRLVSVLQGRFDRRVTIVVGGPGFGKSTLLAQAIHENALAPAGRDHWLSCTRLDMDEQTLVEAIFASTGLPAASKGPPATVVELIGALHRLAPGSCLVLDDLHEIADGSAGHQALQALVGELPSQCSIVIGSRRFPDLPVSGWMVKGQYAFIGEDDLRFTAEELAEVSTLADDDGSLDTESNGGWPALVALELAAGRSGGERYLREVVLAGLDPEVRHLMAVLDAVGGADRELAQYAAGSDITDEQWAAVRAMPLMQSLDSAGVLPHALWGPAIADLLTADERREARARTAYALLDRGRHDDGFSLFADLGDADGCRAVVRAACSGGCTQLGFETMQRWRRALPAAAIDTAEARLLEGLAARDGQTFAPATLELLYSASRVFGELGQVGPEVATLSEAAFVAREQGQEAIFEAIVTRLTELAFAGHLGVVQGYIHLGLAINAERSHDYLTMADELNRIGDDQVSRQMLPRVEWLRSHTSLMLGHPERERDRAQHALDIAEDDFLGARYLIAYLDFLLTPTARVVASLPDITEESAATPFDQMYGGGVVSALHAYVGHIDVARRGLALVRLAQEAGFGSVLRPEYIGILAAATAALNVAEGNDAAARAALLAFFDDHPIEGVEGSRVCRRFAGLVHVLVPEARRFIDEAEWGPTAVRARAAARWFEAIDVSDTADAPPVVLADITPLINVLPLRWVLVAGSRLVHSDATAARQLVEDLVGICGAEVRTVLRDIAERGALDERVADGARRLLGAVRIAPDAPVDIGVLGSLRVDHAGLSPEGVDSVDAELRRERVRQVLTVLAVDGSIRRDELMERIWPDQDARKSSQNLRATLLHLHRVLEPGRDAGDAAFVLRSEGDEIALVGRPWVDTDLQRFDDAMLDADAARADGVHSEELMHLEAALSLVRGEPLVDVRYEEWAAPTARRITGAVVDAARRAAELAFADRRFRAAEDFAERCLAFDPFDDVAHRYAVAAPLADQRRSAARIALERWEGALHEIGAVQSAELAMFRRRLDPTFDGSDH